MAAPLDPVVEHPIVGLADGEFHRSASISTQVFSISAVVLIDHVLVDALIHEFMNLVIELELTKRRRTMY